MIVVEGSLTLSGPPDNLAMQAMQAMVTATRAEVGCISYSFAVDVLDPTVIRIGERWETRTALAAHAKTDHMATWVDALKQIGVAGRDLAMFEADPEPI